ncbi:hypothetical protein CKF54_05130 [Psittacicella hinzii]|uniref:Uncharacterized protein n=1 Tax=Psittacicella hinzii TaxID=2028575 RepID=A0A3A1Y234_9GAMM|nr:hypothetical protein [Psittacicella hinzii]RIY32293.1 hypothetical protein CKF54_05130 [Psittacicella hinzii]
MRKVFLALALGAMSLFSQAAYVNNASKLTNSQIEKQYRELVKEIGYVEGVVESYLLEFNEFADGRTFTLPAFLALYSSTLLAHLNKDFTYIGKVYRPDALIDKIATLGDTCLVIMDRKLNHLLTEEKALCPYISVVYFSADYNRDNLQSLTLFGTTLAVQDNPSAFNKHQNGLANVSKTDGFKDVVKTFKFGFPSEKHFLNSAGSKDFQEIFNVKLVASADE